MLTKKQFLKALTNSDLTEVQRRAIMGVYSMPKHRSTAQQLAALLGYDHHVTANKAFGGAGRRIADYLQIDPPRKNKYNENSWSVVSDWLEELHAWQLKAELVAAIEMTDLAKENVEFDYRPDEVLSTAKLYEGATATVAVTIYERSSAARKKCIKHHGCSCAVCGFSFKNVFGKLGDGFIHVHHLVPLAEIQEEYQIDPIADLRPVCPNCHAMIHKTKAPLSIEELRKIIQTNGK